MSKKRVQEQFGPNAAAYATSQVHAQGASLARLVELVQPQPDWDVLDVATAAGHTAFVFAPHVAHVIGTDLTPEMLTVAAQIAAERGLDNVTFAPADAEALPFDDDSFDLVTCRIAPHHFPDVARFVAECGRVLRPGGRLAIVDNIVPGSRRRGKEAEQLREAGRYVNAFEKLRDPSHGRCLSQDEWSQLFYETGFTILHQETARKAIGFNEWAARLQTPPDDLIRLQALLVQAPPAVAAFLTPQISSDRIIFHLTEIIIIGQWPA